MKTLTLIAAGLLVAASCMAGPAIHLIRRPPVDHTAQIIQAIQTIQQSRVQVTPAKKATRPAPRPMLGLPRNG